MKKIILTLTVFFAATLFASAQENANNPNAPEISFEKEVHDLGPLLPDAVQGAVKKAIHPFPVCHPFLDYLNSNSSKETMR